MPASLFKIVAIKIRHTGRPAQRRVFMPRPLARLALRQPRPAPVTPDWEGPRHLGAFQRAAGYALQRKDSVDQSVARAIAAEGILLHALDPRAALLRAGFTRRQAAQLIRQHRRHPMEVKQWD